MPLATATLHVAASLTAPPRIAALARALGSIEPLAASWSRVLHDARLARLLEQHGLDIVLSPATEPTDTERYAVGLTDGDSRLRVEIAACDHPALAMAARLPACEGTQRLAAAALCAAPLRLLQALGLGHWAPTGLTRIDTRNDTPFDARTPVSASDTPSAWVAVRRHGRCLCLVRFGGATAPLRRALQALVHAQPAHDSPSRGWAMPGRIVLHQQAYALALMSTLAIGDVLLMQPIPAAKTGLPVLARWGAATGRCLEAKASLRGNQMQIQAMPALSADETLHDEAGAEHRPPESLDELTVPVRFEIETVAMTLRDLTSFGPGYVIELTTPVATATIRLVACGQVVGHAELVAVGGQLGARITHMVER